jgi:hypothetical protein
MGGCQQNSAGPDFSTRPAVKAVALVVWASRLEPLDVGRVQGDGHRPEPHVEAAHGTAVFVGGEHPLPELRVAYAAPLKNSGGDDLFPFYITISLRVS